MASDQTTFSIPEVHERIWTRSVDPQLIGAQFDGFQHPLVPAQPFEQILRNTRVIHPVSVPAKDVEGMAFSWPGKNGENFKCVIDFEVGNHNE